MFPNKTWYEERLRDERAAPKGWVMRYFVIGLLFSFIVMAPGSAESAEGIMNRVLPFTAGSAATKMDDIWKTCGSYFASVETTNGKMVHFTYEKGSPHNLRVVFAFVTVDWVFISRDENMLAPLVTVHDDGLHGPRFFLAMNTEDYKIGMLCLGRDMKIQRGVTRPRCEASRLFL